MVKGSGKEGKGRSKNEGCLALNRANIAMLECNVATFQRAITTNVATLRCNVATFHRVVKMTS